MGADAEDSAFAEVARNDGGSVDHHALLRVVA